MFKIAMEIQFMMAAAAILNSVLGALLCRDWMRVMTGDENTGHEKAGQENARQEFDGQKNNGQENDGQQHRTNAV